MRKGDSIFPAGGGNNGRRSTMRHRRFPALILAFCMLLLMPSASAAGYTVKNIACQSYPGIGGNNLPIVGQSYSAFYCDTTTEGVSVTGWSLIDDLGAPCVDTVHGRNYTLNIDVEAVPGYSISFDAAGMINYEGATVSVSADGSRATLSRYIYPLLIAPTIWHEPGDEEHNAGETFSYVASASQLYSSFRWYVRTGSEQVMPAEEVQNLYPDVTVSVADLGSSGTRCNFNQVKPEMDDWHVYCVFKGEGGEAKTREALITVTNAEQILSAPPPTPEATPIPTPAPVEATTAPAPAESIIIVEPPQEFIENGLLGAAPDDDEEMPEGIYIVEEDWATEWTYDADYHWHKNLVPGHDEVNDKGTHEFVWHVLTPATKKTLGVEEGECSICGYKADRSLAYSRTAEGVQSPDMLKLIILTLSAIILFTVLIIIASAIRENRKRRRRARMSGSAGRK